MRYLYALLLALLLPACTITLQVDCVIITGRGAIADGSTIIWKTIECPAEPEPDSEPVQSADDFYSVL